MFCERTEPTSAPHGRCSEAGAPDELPRLGSAHTLALRGSPPPTASTLRGTPAAPGLRLGAHVPALSRACAPGARDRNLAQQAAGALVPGHQPVTAPLPRLLQGLAHHLTSDRGFLGIHWHRRGKSPNCCQSRPNFGRNDAQTTGAVGFASSAGNGAAGAERRCPAEACTPKASKPTTAGARQEFRRLASTPRPAQAHRDHDRAPRRGAVLRGAVAGGGAARGGRRPRRDGWTTAAVAADIAKIIKSDPDKGPTFPAAGLALPVGDYSKQAQDGRVKGRHDPLQRRN